VFHIFKLRYNVFGFHRSNYGVYQTSRVFTLKNGAQKRYEWWVVNNGEAIKIIFYTSSCETCNENARFFNGNFNDETVVVYKYRLLVGTVKRKSTLSANNARKYFYHGGTRWTRLREPEERKEKAPVSTRALSLQRITVWKTASSILRRGFVHGRTLRWGRTRAPAASVT
jgi:hypothetical protein